MPKTILRAIGKRKAIRLTPSQERTARNIAVSNVKKELRKRILLTAKTIKPKKIITKSKKVKQRSKFLTKSLKSVGRKVLR